MIKVGVIRPLFKKLTVLTLTIAGLFAASQSFGQIYYGTPSGATDSGGSLDAQVEFSLSGDVLAIELTDLEQNPKSAAQLISGLTFLVDNGTGTSYSSSDSSGQTTSIASDGSYTPSSTQTLTHWGVSSSGSGASFKVNMTTLTGGQPKELIIGPDNAGGLSGAGLYNNANSSIFNFLPTVLGTATFDVTVSGLSSLSQISGVQFVFGTNPDGTADGVPVPGSAVPEPSTIISGLLLLVPLSIQVVRSINRNSLQPIKTDH